MVKRNHKYKTGEGAQYVSRRMAIRKLQLPMSDFRQLCILKGIYPREPKNRARAQQGDTAIKILYHKKDITFLLHEPIVSTLRARKINERRTLKAAAKRNPLLKRIHEENQPIMRLDNIVKERFPTFMDAVKELDDCLTLLFTLRNFPAMKSISRNITSMARRMTVEFMHYVIATQTLRKVFISIKGYYFQADIRGEMVTWIVPHYFPFQPQHDEYVDYNIIKSFADFYVIMAGFVNYQLFNTANLVYPPALAHDVEENADSGDTFAKIASLNVDLLRSDGAVDEETEEPTMLEWTGDNEDLPHVKQIREEAQSLKKLKNLFKGLKFFINRDVPWEPLAFIIRCFGGKVSWDKVTAVGATYDEDDETITHHLIDRPKWAKKFISRDYVQPQWVFDSVNQRRLLPTNNYFMNATLPPHLSPFNREDAVYVPPEELALQKGEEFEKVERSGLDDGIDIGDIAEQAQQAKNQVRLDYALMEAFRSEKSDAADGGESDDNNDEKEEEEEEEEKEEKLPKDERKAKKDKMAVVSGKMFKENVREERMLDKQEHGLRARMVKSRHKKLYRSMMEKKKKAEKEANLLKMKRQKIDKQKRVEQAEKRKKQRSEILA